MAKISVLVPVYNVAPYLKKCMDSILSQTLDDIEILCGDGGSTDGSLEILREYESKDSRVHVISKKGSGYGQSMNECLAMATGEYIGIVESDDLVRRDMYAVLFHAAEHFNADIVLSDFYHYYDDGGKKIINILEHDCDYGKVILPHKRHDIFKAVIATWSGIYRREFLLKNNIRYNDTPGGAFQDIGFWCKALCFAQRMAAVHRPFYMWRQDNPASSVKQSDKAAERTYREFDLLFDFFRASAPDVLKEYADGLTWRRLASYFWVSERLTWEDTTKHFARAANDFQKLRQSGEYSEALFSEAEKAAMSRIDMCYEETNEKINLLRLQWDIEDKKREIDALKSSREYRVGRAFYAASNAAGKMLAVTREKGIRSLTYSLLNKLNREGNKHGSNH